MTDKKPPYQIARPLPDELLMQIIDLLCAEAEKAEGRRNIDKIITCLSLVSWKFRRAVANTVSLWARVDNNYCLQEGFDERIARSKNAPLILHINLFRMQSGDKETLFMRLMVLKDRCKHIRTKIPWGIYPAAPGMEFPLVESAYLRTSFFGRERDEESFYRAWKFPRIKTLEGSGKAPPSGSFRDLVAVKLRIDIDRHSGNYYYNHVMMFLGGTARLECLFLYLCGDGFYTPFTLTHVDLPYLVAFSLSTYRDESDNDGVPEHIRWVLSSLKMPMIRDFHLGLFLDDWNQSWIPQWTGLKASIAHQLQRVSSLSIFSTQRLNKDCMELIIASLPNVRKLRIDAPSIVETLQIVEPDLKLGHLRSLVLVVDHFMEPWKVDQASALSISMTGAENLELLLEKRKQKVLEVWPDDGYQADFKPLQ